MKFLASLVLFLSMSFAQAAPVVASGVDEAKKVAESKCEKACLIMDEADAIEFDKKIQEVIQEAYQAGLKGWSKVSKRSI